jgi:glycerol-3-phosphate acyltransferase PlsX
VLAGAAQALRDDPQLKLILTGFADVVEPFAAAAEMDAVQSGRVEAVATTEAIGMDEHPANAVKAKRDSSIVVGCKLVKEGRAQGFFSAGSTGACMAAATLFIGRARGVARPAIATVLPAPAHPVVLLDVGANADVKADYLLQFGQMGRIYAQRLLGVKAPRVGLLNIGAEDTKGSQLAQEAFALMQERLTGFVGNAEGGDLLGGDFDVVVTDGFTGNVALKAIEGTAGMLFDQLREVLSASVTRKLGSVLIMPGLRQLKKMLSADEVGGAPLLGLKSAVIIGHGSSGPVAIANGIAATVQSVRANMAQVVEEALS